MPRPDEAEACALSVPVPPNSSKSVSRTKPTGEVDLEEWSAKPFGKKACAS